MTNSLLDHKKRTSHFVFNTSLRLDLGRILKHVGCGEVWGYSGMPPVFYRASAMRAYLEHTIGDVVEISHKNSINANYYDRFDS